MTTTDPTVERPVIYEAHRLRRRLAVLSLAGPSLTLQDRLVQGTALDAARETRPEGVLRCNRLLLSLSLGFPIRRANPTSASRLSVRRPSAPIARLATSEAIERTDEQSSRVPPCFASVLLTSKTTIRLKEKFDRCIARKVSPHRAILHAHTYG